MAKLSAKSKANLTDMITKTSVPFVVSNPKLPDNPIVLCNTAFVKLTGYSKSEIIGRNCRFLAGKDTQPEQTHLIVNAVQNQQPILVQILNYKRDGSPFRNALMIAPMLDEVGELSYFLGSQMELPEGRDLTWSTKQTMALERINLLSPQQKRVLTEVAKGCMNKQIAHILQISESTVKMHRSEALAKLNVSTSAEAIRLLVEAGF